MALSNADLLELAKRSKANKAMTSRIYNPFGGQSMADFRGSVGWDNPVARPEIGTGAGAVYRGRPVQAFTNKADSPLLSQAGMDARVIEEPDTEAEDAIPVVKDHLNYNVPAKAEAHLKKEIPDIIKHTFGGTISRVSQMNPEQKKLFLSNLSLRRKELIDIHTAAYNNAKAQYDQKVATTKEKTLTRYQLLTLAQKYGEKAGTVVDPVTGEKRLDPELYSQGVDAYIKKYGAGVPQPATPAPDPGAAAPGVRAGQDAIIQANHLVDSGAVKTKEQLFQLAKQLKASGQIEVLKAVTARLRNDMQKNTTVLAAAPGPKASPVPVVADNTGAQKGAEAVGKMGSGIYDAVAGGFNAVGDMVGNAAGAVKKVVADPNPDKKYPLPDVSPSKLPFVRAIKDAYSPDAIAAPFKAPVYRGKPVAAKQGGKRPDGTKKGPGFLGSLKRPDGKVSTEISIGVKFDGKETLIPALVPTLTTQEVQHLLSGGKVTAAILEKAAEHAKKRMRAGKSPFREPGENVGAGQTAKTAARG